MRRALLVLALVALAAPLNATGERAAPEKVAGTVLAIESAPGGDFLVRVDAETLRPVSKRLALGGHVYAWSLSPDGRRLAIGFTQTRGIRIVDVRRMKRVARIATWSGGVSSLAWVSPRRLLGSEFAGIFLLDPVARKRLSSPQISGNVLVAERVDNQLVLLTAPSVESGPTALAVVGGDGAVRSVRLDRIRATGSISDEIGEFYRPALVLDPAGRAYVAGAAGGEPVAKVDLESLTVTYHEPELKRPLLARLRNWLEPAAEAKEPMAGGFRTGAWLGDGKFALWGTDSTRTGDGRVDTTPTGLSVVDTTDWSARMIDAHARHAAFAEGTLLASYEHGGLAGFTTDGDRRYHLFDHDRTAVEATFGSRAFVLLDGKPVHVIDAVTGRVLATRRTTPRLLHSTFQGW